MKRLLDDRELDRVAGRERTGQGRELDRAAAG